MRVPFLALAALTPAIVLAAPASKPSSDIAGFTRGAPLPKWSLPLAEIPSTQSTEHVVVRLSETLAWVGATPAVTYNRAIQVNDSAELGVIGQFSISYFAQYQKLALHRVVLLRGEQRLDRTASVNIRPLQRETGIESGMLGGATSVQLLLDDVRAGDTLWITYTIEGENPVFGKRWAADYHLEGGTPLELRRITILHPRNRPLLWRQLGDFQQQKITPTLEVAGDIERIRFEARGLETIEGEPSVPADYIPVRTLQFSEYQDWQDVAAWADSLFPKLPASSSLKALAQQMRQQGDASAQAAAALHWVQNEIRYFSVSIGENSHRPQPPETVLQRRYGDCKDKSYLLISLLRELGIEAKPLLLSADAPRVAAKLLATPTWFNHVIVQISINGHDYYVDPTRTNQPEPLEAMPIAFPGASVLAVDAATRALSTIPERSDALPAFEHEESFTVQDFSGPAMLETRDTYRGNYADAMRQYFPRMSANEQKKKVLADYEKQYPGVTLEGAPSYQDKVKDNLVEIVSHYKLPKAIRLQDQTYQLDFSSKIIDGTLGIPSKLVRNFPFELASGQYHGRYRLHIHWPSQVRVSEPPRASKIDNDFFELRTEHAFQGSEGDYLIDYRLKQRTLPASELPALQEQSKQLNEYIESTMRLDSGSVVSAVLMPYSYRDLDSLRKTYAVEDAVEKLKPRKDQDIALSEACDYLRNITGLHEFVDWQAYLQAERMEKKLEAAKQQPGYALCKARLAFATADYAAGASALAEAGPLPDDEPLQRELAWAQLYNGDSTRAVATMARYRAARGKAAKGMADAQDLASQIALLQRAGQPLPTELIELASADPAGPWPHPLLAMQVGAISSEQLLQMADKLAPDAKMAVLNDAWFYIGQARLAAQDKAGALPAFRWFNINGLRGNPLTIQARAELRQLRASTYEDQGLRASLNKDYAGALAFWRQGVAVGEAGSQYGMGLAALNGNGMSKDVAQALHWFTLAAEQGYPEAQDMLGTMYSRGTGTAANQELALGWLRKAAEQDDRNALYDLGYRYRWGQGVKQDYAQALRYLRPAAEQGASYAMTELASMYRFGEGVTQDYAMAEFWNRRAISYRNPDAMYNLGRAFEYGEGMAKDEAKAAVMFRNSAEAGSSAAAVELGYMYEMGTGVERDFAAAVAWYRKAAEQDNRLGLRNLAGMYANGKGVRKDDEKAVELYRKAAELGESAAMVSLGYFYENARALPHDVVKAREWYLKAAQFNNAAAEFNLALIYEDGKGVAADPKQALEWYRKSAEHGDVDAQYRIATALREGDGLAVNKRESFDWYKKAAAQGHARAQAELGRMYMNGWGTPVDYGKAVDVLQKAVEQNHFGAMSNLGYLYETGKGVSRDLGRAIRLYQRPAEFDMVYACVRLSHLYLNEAPPWRDESKGKQLRQKALQQSTAEGYATLGFSLSTVEDLAGAENAYQRAVELETQHPQDDGVMLRVYLQSLIDFYLAHYQYAKAEQPMLRSLALWEKVLDANGGALADRLEALGDLYQNLGRYDQAERQYLRVLAVREQVYGPSSPEVAEMQGSIGNLYQTSDQFAKADAILRRTLALYENMPDAPQGKISWVLGNLSLATWARGQYAEAEAQLQRALALDEKAFGAQDSHVMSTLNTLAVIQDRRGKYDQASASMERAIAIASKILDQESVGFMPFLNNLAHIRIQQKQYAEADRLLHTTLATRERALGDDHPDVSNSLHYLGVLYKNQQRYAEAEPMLQRAIAIRERWFGPDFSEVADALQDLGQLYSEQGQYVKAEPLLERTLKIRSAILSANHLDIQETRRSLASLYRKTNREHAATELEKSVVLR